MSSKVLKLVAKAVVASDLLLKLTVERVEGSEGSGRGRRFLWKARLANGRS